MYTCAYGFRFEMYAWCAAIFLRISSPLPIVFLRLFSYNPRNNGGKQKRKTEEKVNNRITDEGEKCRREEENYVFRHITVDEGAEGRIFPRKKLPKITLFRLRLVFSPLNPVSRERHASLDDPLSPIAATASEPKQRVTGSTEATDNNLLPRACAFQIIGNRKFSYGLRSRDRPHFLLSSNQLQLGPPKRARPFHHFSWTANEGKKAR